MIRATEPSESPLGVGVIGCGYWGPNVARNFAESARAQVLGIADLREDRLEHMGRRFPHATLTTEFERLIADERIEAVVITTPVSSHAALARAALEAGKHVLLAKPMAATVAEAEGLAALAEEQQRVLLVDHTFVYTGAVRKIKRLLDDGTLGRLYYLDSVRVNLGLFQHDVNVIWDLAAHDFSIVLHLLGRLPLTVSATGASHSASGHVDVAYVTLAFEDDLIVHCHLNWLSPVKIRQTLIGGSERMLVWDDLAADEKLRVYDRGIREIPDEKGIYQALVDYRVGDVWMPQVDRSEALSVEVEHFIDCVRHGTAPITGAAMGIDVVRLLEATAGSLRERGRALTLAELVTD